MGVGPSACGGVLRGASRRFLRDSCLDGVTSTVGCRRGTRIPYRANRVLIAMSGLPGVGKTAISRELVRSTSALHLRVDSIEQALRAGGLRVEGEGYAVACAVAEDNLVLGRVVIADCVNPWPLTRQAWHAVAERAGVRAVDVEVVCSDTAEHRRRVESRVADIDGHELPTWKDVIERDYRPWDRSRLVVDTASLSVAESARAIIGEMSMRRISDGGIS